MLRNFAAIALLMLTGTGVIGVSTAFADNWGCSYEKCLQTCAKVGGQRCSGYCTKQLRDKQLSNICK